MTRIKGARVFLQVAFLLVLTGKVVPSAVVQNEEPSVNNPYDIPTNVLFAEKTFQELAEDPSASAENVKLLMQSIVPPYMQDILSNLNSIEDDIGDLNMTETCKGHLLELVYLYDSSRIGKLLQTTWALHMMDSWGKIPEGLLSGHVNSMGDYDECMKVEVTNLEILNPTNPPNLQKDFNGKFCNVIIIPPQNLPTSRKGAVSPGELIDLIGIQQGVRIIPTTSICIPSTCTTGDAQVLSSYIIKQPFNTLVQTCSAKETRTLNTGDWVMVGVLGTIGLLIFLGTMIDGCMERSASPDKPKRKPSTGVQVLIAFSAITNIRKWQAVGHGGGAENFSCLHGLRFMSTLWVILAHTWYMVIYVPWWNMVDVKTVHKTWTILTILNATLAVDTFFVMGGMLVAYNLLKNYEKTKGKMNYVMYVVHRYLRLTPTYAILVGIMATVFPYLGSGPYWALMDLWGKWCREHWWTNLLYVNNLVYPDEICQAEAWYLSDDMQFYVLTPLIVWPLWKFKVPGVIIFGLLTAVSIVAPGLQVHFTDTVPTVIGSRFMGRMYQDIYIKPWARVQTYLVGMWLGYLMFKTRGKKIKLPTPVVLFGWLASTAIALSTLYGIYPWFDPLNEIPVGLRFFYASFHRVGWGIAICWIIFACIHGYGGYINNFLSWSPFVPLGRLSFTTYLVSLHVQTILHLTMRQPIQFTSYIMTNLFFAHVIMSLIVGFFCTIAFESPFIQLEKILLGGGNRGPRPATVKPPEKRYGIFYNTTDAIVKGLEKEEHNNNSTAEAKPKV